MNTIFSESKQACKVFLKTTYCAYRNGVLQTLLFIFITALLNLKAPHNWELYAIYFCLCYTLAHYWIFEYVVNRQWIVKVTLSYIIGLLLAIVALFIDARMMDLLYMMRMRQEWIESPSFIVAYFFVPLYSILFIYAAQRVKKLIYSHTSLYKAVTVIANIAAVLPIILLICLYIFSVQ